jgi:methionine sulfoxide reductase heme-binding subunit
VSLLVGATTTPTAYWYLTRATGTVALLLVTAAIILGVLSSVRWRSDRLPRFLVGGLHRNVTLLATVFVVAHVVTTVADGYAPIGLKDALIPFLSRYRPLWLALGTVAFDLLLALVVTSYLRARLGYRAWRAVHWLGYASWPVALLHSLGTGTDARLGWMAFIGFACFALVAASVLLRATRSTGNSGVRVAAGAATIVLTLAIFGWYRGGPHRHGWAARAGTPVSLLRRAHGTVASSPGPRTSLPAGTFDATLSGHVKNSGPGSDGLVTVDIRGKVAGRVRGDFRLTLWGVPAGSGGVAMTASDVAFAATGTTSPYTGHVVSLAGNHVEAQLTNASGARVDLAFVLRLGGPDNAVTGSIHGKTVS